MKKGQSTLEVALTMIMIILLIGGIIKIWLWGNNQIVERQIRYNTGRVAAGTATDNYDLNQHLNFSQPAALNEADALPATK